MYRNLPNSWEGVMGNFSKLSGEEIRAYGFYDVVTPDYNSTIQKLSDILSGADANDGFEDPLESALQIIHDFEHELSVGVPTATEKAISKFRELNSTSLKTLEDKMRNIRMTIAEGINSGITKMSEGLARAFVFGENLKDTFKNMARTLLVNVLSALIEIVARKGVELAIEKLDKTLASNAFKEAQPEIMRGVTKGLLHKNTASRKVSRLAARVKAVSA